MLGRVLWNVHDLSRPVGIVTVRIELGQLQSYVMNTSAGQLIYLETDDGEVVISSGQDGMEHRVQPLSRPMNRERFEPMTAGDSEYLVRDSGIGSTNLYLRSVLSADTAAQAVNQARYQVLLVYGAVCGFIDMHYTGNQVHHTAHFLVDEQDEPGPARPVKHPGYCNSRG